MNVDTDRYHENSTKVINGNLDFDYTKKDFCVENDPSPQLFLIPPNLASSKLFSEIPIPPAFHGPSISPRKSWGDETMEVEERVNGF